MPFVAPANLLPIVPIEPIAPKLDLGKIFPLTPSPQPTPTPAPTQIPALVPYPVATPYPTYTTTPTSVQPRPLAEVQRAAIDPTLLLLGGIAVLALFVAVMRK